MSVSTLTERSPVSFSHSLLELRGSSIIDLPQDVLKTLCANLNKITSADINLLLDAAFKRFLFLHNNKLALNERNIHLLFYKTFIDTASDGHRDASDKEYDLFVGFFDKGLSEPFDANHQVVLEAESLLKESLVAWRDQKVSSLTR